ncbi:ribonucleoside-diphosphate reductase subunit alpha [Candidatus Pacebacteria bacterium]|nr:ribonucleoside-diphosphate reductase subunit alpha [Candidatus Paceibacterota bacterium]
MFETITKRNGEVVPFAPEKMLVAMRKAFAAESVSVEDATLQQMVDRVLAKLTTTCDSVKDEPCPTVELVQDLVEETLMERGYFNVAKGYILYRFRQTEERKDEVVEKIEENRLMIKTSDGEEQFSREEMRKYVGRFATGIENDVDLDEVVNQIEREVYDGISTKELSKLVTLVLRARIEEDPAYSTAAARQLCARLYHEAIGEDTDVADSNFTKKYQETFEKNIKEGVEHKKLAKEMLSFDFAKITAAIKPERDDLFRYLGVETLNDRYFIRNTDGKILETPQYMWMRIAMGLAFNEAEKEARAIEFYEVMSTLRFVPSTPTLFHAGTPHPQLSSCYLNVVEDDLNHIFKVFGDNAQLSKWAGGIGTSWSKLRATGALIKTAGITSQGTIPFLKIANDVTVAINRSGRRRGATCVYMENWHYDFPDFLELRKNTGDERRRTHDMNTASWISDLFMKRVKEDGEWTLFSPDEAVDLTETFGKKFEELYEKYEEMADRGEIHLFKRMKARDLWKKHLGMLFETGHPWVTFKDPSNIRSPQDHVGVVHNSNLCTEITLNTSADETAVCNLGSVNFIKHVKDGTFDTEKVRETVTTAMRMLDNVIDLNFYPTKEARNSNMRHRPVGLGVMGFQDALYELKINFDSEECVDFADSSMEVVSHAAIAASSQLAKERGAYESFAGSKWDRGILPVDTVALLEEERGMTTGVNKDAKLDWGPVRESIKQHGIRNSNCMAIAPTATISNIAGSIPGIEPIYKNIYVKANISGDFIIVNNALIRALKEAGLWSKEMLDEIKYNDGSLQGIDAIPADLKERFKETFEIDMRWLVKAAAARGKWIDQSQSLNIFYSGTSGKEISDLYLYAWEAGVKTTYYLRSLGASQVEKSTINAAGTQIRKKADDGATPAAEPVAPAAEQPTPSPMATPSPIQKEQVDAAKVSEAVATKPKKQFKLHVAEEAVCESCQ